MKVFICYSMLNHATLAIRPKCLKCSFWSFVVVLDWIILSVNSLCEAVWASECWNK